MESSGSGGPKHKSATQSFRRTSIIEFSAIWEIEPAPIAFSYFGRQGGAKRRSQADKWGDMQGDKWGLRALLDQAKP